jgi:ribonuclease P protein component
VQRKFRLTRSEDFEQARRSGKSYAHRLVVLLVRKNETGQTRVGVAAGRTVGKAVQRNRAKRLLRAAVRGLLTSIAPGLDLVLIARAPLTASSYAEVVEAVTGLVRRARLTPDS